MKQLLGHISLNLFAFFLLSAPLSAAVVPVMDSMAANGVHLKNAFVTTSLCSPSRASILTGLYTFRHRVIDNQRAVPEGTQFYSQYLQKAGYNTAFVGKWPKRSANPTKTTIRFPIIKDG